MRKEFIAEVTRVAKSDPRVILVTGDLGFGVLDEYAEMLPHQFINAGVAEQNMMSMSAGLAAAGYRVLVYSIGNFSTLRCLEQIRNDVCYHNLDVTVVSVGSGFSYGALGYSHHAIEDIAVMRGLPNLQILSPSDSIEARAVARWVLQSSGPSYVRLGKDASHYETDLQTVPDITQPVPLRNGNDLVLLGTGSIMTEVLKAADLLEERGVYATVFSCPRIKPFGAAFLRHLSLNVPWFSIEEHCLDGGFGSVILEAINDVGLEKRIVRLGVDHNTTGVVGSDSYLRQQNGLDAASIVEKVVAARGEVS